MGRCSKCGSPTPGNVQGYQLCVVCAQRERLQKDAEQKKDNAATGYQPAAHSWQTNARVHKSGSGIRTLLILAIVIAGAFLGVRYWMFQSAESKLAASFEITEPLSGDGADFVNEILNRDNSAAVWSMKITDYPTDYWKTLFEFSQKSAFVKGYLQNGETVWKYDFEEADAGTGLHGVYYLAPVNGVWCLIDDDKETLYPENTAFYQEQYAALSALQYDTLMPKLTDGLVGGEYGAEKHDDKVVLKNGDVSVGVYNDEYHKTRILDERGEGRVQYEWNYYASVSEQLPDFSAYKTAA